MSDYNLIMYDVLCYDVALLLFKQNYITQPELLFKNQEIYQ